MKKLIVESVYMDPSAINIGDAATIYVTLGYEEYDIDAWQDLAQFTWGELAGNTWGDLE